MPKNLTEKRKVGNLGESIACRFLIGKGFSISDRNYSRSWGELDIVAKREGRLHFIEVKSVSCENLDSLNRGVRAEENMHRAKISKLLRVIHTYLSEHHISHETHWQLDLVAVYIEERTKRAHVSLLEAVGGE